MAVKAEVPFPCSNPVSVVAPLPPRGTNSVPVVSLIARLVIWVILVSVIVSGIWASVSEVQVASVPSLPRTVFAAPITSSCHFGVAVCPTMTLPRETAAAVLSVWVALRMSCADPPPVWSVPQENRAVVASHKSFEVPAVSQSTSPPPERAAPEAARANSPVIVPPASGR